MNATPPAAGGPARPPPKPMRLGTKSCLECRRRKVRCNMTAGLSRCRQCFLHRIKCVPQGPPPEVSDDSSAVDTPKRLQLSLPDSLPLDQFPKLKAVLDNLSQAAAAYETSAVSQSGSTSGVAAPDDSAQSSHLLASVLESLLSDNSDKLTSLSSPLLARSLSSQTPTQTQAQTPGQTQSPAQSHFRSPLATSPAVQAPVSNSSTFSTAPLLSHLRSTLLTPAAREHDEHPSPAALGTPRHDHVARRIPASLIPHQNTLQSVFELTQPFWSVWPLAPHFPSTVVDAVRFICDELHNCDDGGAAKRLIWLSMCISQLPRDFVRRHPHALAIPAPELVLRLFETSRDFVATAVELSCSLETLEALMMQYKCHLNLGRPRQGWKCVRLALDNSILLGLHRLEARDVANARGRDIWTSVWRADRQMTLFLGVPHSLPDSFLNLPTVASPSPHSVMDDFMDQAMVIGGQIVERNHTSQTSAYSRTAAITDQVDRLRAMIPEDWWLPSRIDTEGQPLGLPFWQTAIVFFYHYINHLLHLPYVLPGKENLRFQYSRDVALASAEGMLLAFQRLPTCNNVPVVCDWLDFATFSGAIVLVADLLAGKTRRLASEEERLWALVARFAKDMRRKSEMLECIVSRQSADVLEHLHAVRYGVYDGPDEYEVVVPYFGRVCIRHPRRLLHPQQKQLQQYYPLGQHHQHQQPHQLPTTPSAHPLPHAQAQQQHQHYQHQPQHQQPSPYSTTYSHSPAASSSSSAPAVTPITLPTYGSPAGQTAVEFNWNLCRSAQQPTSEMSAMELCTNWANQTFLPGPDDWNAVFEFGMAAEGVPGHGQVHAGAL